MKNKLSSAALCQAVFFLLPFFCFINIAKAQGPVRSGMIAHYCFDGDANDALGVKNCTVYGAVPTPDRLGRANRAYYFDGINDYIQMPSDVWVSGEFSISGWLYVETYKSFGRFFEFGNGTFQDNVQYSATPSGTTTSDAYSIRRQACVPGSPTHQYSNAPAFPMKTWVFVTIVHRGSVGEIWRNAVNVTAASMAMIYPCSTMRTQCYFGKSPWTTDEYFHGKMDDVRIYNRALSAAEIDTLYKLDIACNPCAAFIAGFKDSLTSCFSYQFTDTTVISEKGIATWKWDFGDLTTSTSKNPAHTYADYGTYNVRLIATDSGGCIDTVTKSITINYTHFANAGRDTTLCLINDSVTVFLRGARTGISYSWIPDTMLSHSSSSSTYATLVKPTMFILTVTDAQGCIDKDSVMINLFPNAAIVATPKDTSICAASTIRLNASGGKTYSWTPSSGLDSPSKATTLANITTNTKYIVKGTDNNGCIGRDSVSIKILPAVVVTAIPENSIGCKGDKISFVASGAGTYKWTPSEGLSNDSISNPEHMINGVATYIVKGMNSAGCAGYDTVFINEYPAPVVDAYSSENIISCRGKEARLNATGASSYTWSPSEYVSDRNASSVLANPPVTTVFSVEGTNDNGCKATDTISVIYENKAKVYLPNAFSPNNDMINDDLRIVDNCNFILSNFSIYNRWGQKVFETNNLLSHWDGTFNGNLCELGVYYYLVKGKDLNGQEAMFKGDISLLR